MAKIESSYKIAREGRIVRIDFKRSPSIEEVRELLLELESLDDSRLRMYVMIEAEILLSTADIREGAARAVAAGNQPERIAVVAPGDISYGISRIYKVFRENDHTRQQVFRTLEEARAWLLEDQPG